MSKAILVTGATGNQGGALIKALIGDTSLSLIALTRNAQSPSAVKLKEQGVSVIEGDLNNVPAIFEQSALKEQKLWGVFSVQVGEMLKTADSSTAPLTLQLLESRHSSSCHSR